MPNWLSPLKADAPDAVACRLAADRLLPHDLMYLGQLHRLGEDG